MKPILAFVFGLLFGAGLVVSGMTSPDKVIGFLDVAGQWDPSLAFVMGGAVLTAAPLFAVRRRRERRVPRAEASRPIDVRLVVGAAIFGIGWGIGGICPGPAFVDLPILPGAALPFLVAMFVGLLISPFILLRKD